MRAWRWPVPADALDKRVSCGCGRGALGLGKRACQAHLLLRGSFEFADAEFEVGDFAVAVEVAFAFLVEGSKGEAEGTHSGVHRGCPLVEGGQEFGFGALDGLRGALFACGDSF